MKKIDFKRTLKELYNPPRKPVIVDVPSMNFLMIDGQGDPVTSKEYQEALEALYAVAYGVKFQLKKAGIIDYTVPPLEGLWWADNMEEWSMDHREDWKWTMMIMQPEQVTQEHVDQIIGTVRRKKDLQMLSKMRFKPYNEGLSVQILYIGPYHEEGPTIKILHQFALDKGYELHRKHHEIYLGDPRRT
ncbi:MAG: GyrI-like domain-containing protein, partial [Promethearchaeota archaeon]